MIATTGGFGRSRATRIAVEPDDGPADDRRQFQRLGDLPRGVGNGVADGGFRLRALRRQDRCDRVGSRSTSSPMRFIVETASTGNLPAADSADSMMASAPS